MDVVANAVIADDLTEQNRSALRSFIATKSDSLLRFDPAEYAERQLEALTCLACHARDGAGDRWSLLAPEGPETDGGAPSEDGYDDIETIHLQRPQLDFAGEKLRTGWMGDFLAGRLDYKPRPGLTARMPAFPAQAENIARGLAAQHGFPPVNGDRSPVDSVLAATGRKLALSDDLFRCNSCHSVGADGPLAGPDMETINFAHIPDRLRRGYFDRFILDPHRILPGTQMPQYAMDDGTSGIPHSLDGDMARQFDAIWHFMRSLDDQDNPD